MATITIENAAVARIIEGYGFAAVEEKRILSGETIKMYYTVWTKEPVQSVRFTPSRATYRSS
jgi:hypothetical protein